MENRTFKKKDLSKIFDEKEETIRSWINKGNVPVLERVVYLSSFTTWATPAVSLPDWLKKSRLKTGMKLSMKTKFFSCSKISNIARHVRSAALMRMKGRLLWIRRQRES